jgi:threonine/homoserine efflux transporter RhtA
VTALHTPLLYGWLSTAVIGMIYQQAAFRAGSLSASFPTMTVAKPVVAWLLGIIVLGETLHSGDETIFVVAAAAAVTIVATAALARGEAAAVENNAGNEQRRADQPTQTPAR